MLINVSPTPHNNWKPQKIEAALQKYGYVLDYVVREEVELLEDDVLEKFTNHYFSMIAAVSDSCANEPTPFAILLENLPIYLICRLANVLQSSGFDVITSKYVTVKYEDKELKEFAEFVDLIG